jgi:ParB-like chromosome segregation protein Spo0J
MVIVQKMKKTELAELRSEITREQLLTAERSEERLTERPSALPLKKIAVAEQVFQWRCPDVNQLDDGKHTWELVRVLEDHEQPLDPILVTPVGSNFYVVDGHHRLQAYLTAKWKQPVPVSYFDGNVLEAEQEALRLNCKNKLPMTDADKFEAAWRLVKDDVTGLTQKAIADATTISLRTISTMAATLKEHGDQARCLNWQQAKSLQWQTADDDFDAQDWKSEKAKKMAGQLLKNLGSDPYKHPDILALAFRYLNEDLAVSLRNALNDELSDLEDDDAGELDI